MTNTPNPSDFDPLANLRGASSHLDYSEIIPQDFSDAMREQELEEVVEEHEELLDETEDEQEWRHALIALGSTVVVWLMAFGGFGWFMWIVALGATAVTVLLFFGIYFKYWVRKCFRELQQIYERSLPSLFGFENIARHFAVKEDEENYDKFITRYQELLEVGSNDPESRAGKEKIAVVRDWAELAVEMEEKAVTPDDVMDELDAENIRKNFSSRDL